MQQYGCALQYVPEEMKHNENVMLAAVQQVGYVLQKAFEDTKNNENVVLSTIPQDSFAF